jgi:hypothetical protein
VSISIVVFTTSSLASLYIPGAPFSPYPERLHNRIVLLTVRESRRHLARDRGRVT